MLTPKHNYELTIQQLRQYPGFENVSDEEAGETIRQLKELSLILYNIFQTRQRKKKLIDSLKNEDNEEE